MSKRVILIFFSCTSLIMGLLTYLVFDRNILLFSYFNLPHQNIEYSFIRNYFSDFFYVLFVCALSHLYYTLKISNIYILILLFSPILHEFHQFFFLFSGTFDLYDLMLYFLVILAYYFFIFRNIENKQKYI